MECIILVFLIRLSHLLHYSVLRDVKLIFDYSVEMLISALNSYFYLTNASMICVMQDIHILSLYFFILLEMNTLNFPTSTMLNSNSTPIAVESWFIPFNLLTIFCLILTIILDFLFISIIILDKTCHTVSMILIANTYFTQLLAAINLLSMSIFAIQNDVQHSQYYDSLCIFRGYVSPSSCGMIIYSFLLQAIHRYTTAVYPTRLFWQSKRTHIILICASWIFCLLYPLAFLFTSIITYNIDNQLCEVQLGVNYAIILTAVCAYMVPISILMYLYLRLMLYVKAMSNRVTVANTLSRAQRELKMMQQTVMFLSVLLILGMPYLIFVLMSLFTTPPKYSFRIAYFSLEVSFPLLVITVFYFTDSLKTSMKKILPRRTNIVVATAA
jgi:hypothetical protein